MKKSLTIVVLVTTLLSLKAFAGEILQYELTPRQIDMVRVIQIPGGRYDVYVRLKKADREYFTKLTGDNVGKRLEIIFRGRVVISPVIEGKIDSGIIVLGPWKSEKKAKKIANALNPAS